MKYFHKHHFFKISSKAVFFAQYDSRGTAVGVRLDPTFPGERTGEDVFAGQVCTSTVRLNVSIDITLHHVFLPSFLIHFYDHVVKVFAFTSTASIDYHHSDGRAYTITFYKLANGRGWVHDFNPDKHGPQIKILVCFYPYHQKNLTPVFNCHQSP